MPDKHIKFHSSNGKRVVLVAENDGQKYDALSQILQDNYDLIRAQDGAQTCELLEEKKDLLGLVMLNQKLPDTDGLKILKRIVENPDLKKLPVIVISEDPSAEAKSLTLGAMDYLPASLPPKEVVLARVLRSIELSEIRETIYWTERDHLTGLFNREYFYHYAEQYDTHHKDEVMDAVVVDINHFHIINERYGKVYGDEVIKRIGRGLFDLIKDSGGMVGRRAGDTFLIYCPHRSGYMDILETASVKITDDGKSRVRVRVGVYANVDKNIDMQQRFHRAKMAADNVRTNYARGLGMYDASLHETEVFSVHLLEDFHSALQDNQFVVYFQPKFDIRDKEPVLNSAEALVRWQHPEHGLLSPGVFVPLFESNGLIRELDNFVWRSVVKQMREWKDRFGDVIPVSVNVSRVDMYDEDLKDHLVSLTEEYGIKPGELLLEITESAYTQDSAQIVENVKQLQEAGFLIEMDDFGSGYSSLNMISELPIDVMKLDMQFIRSAFREHADTRVMEAVIRIADSLYVPTVAEGVETEEQMLALKAMGCDIAQGYLFSRPVPAKEYEKFLEERLAMKNAPAAIELAHGSPGLSKKEMDREPMFDPVTGLYSYAAFEMLIKDADLYHTALLVAQMNGYRLIAHLSGLKAAEERAKEVAELLQQFFRSGDLICRLASNEFGIIMTRVNSSVQNQVIGKINKINEILAESPDGGPDISLSVGVAFADREHPNGDMFQDADTALYRLIESQRSGCEIY